MEEWSVHAAKLQGETYNIVGGEERANAKNLRRGSETKGVMSMVLDAAGKDELPQASRCRYCRLQKQRISVVLHTAIAEQVVNELACDGGRVHGAKCLAALVGVA